MTSERSDPKKAIKPYMYALILGAIIVPSGIGIGMGIVSLTDTSNDPDDPYTPPDPPPPPTPPPQNWEIDAQGTVTYIVDGDTYDMNSVGRVRLADIDCPDQGEAGCQEAEDYLSSLIYNKLVYVDIDDVYGTDIYDRTVAVVYVRYNSTHLLNVNKNLLVQGFATIWNFDNEFNPYTWDLFVYYE